MRLLSIASMAAVLTASSWAQAQQEGEERVPSVDRAERAERAVDFGAIFVEGPPTPYEAVVHSVDGLLIVLATPIEASREQDLLTIGFRRVTSPKEIEDRTIYQGFVYQQRQAQDEAIFAGLRQGMKIRYEARFTSDHQPIIVSVRPLGR